MVNRSAPRSHAKSHAMTGGKSLAQTQIEMGGWALGHSSILLPFVFLIVVTLALMCPLLSARRSLPAIRPTLNNWLRSPKAAPALSCRPATRWSAAQETKPLRAHNSPVGTVSPETKGRCNRFSVANRRKAGRCRRRPSKSEPGQSQLSRLLAPAWSVDLSLSF